MRHVVGGDNGFLADNRTEADSHDFLGGVALQDMMDLIGSLSSLENSVLGSWGQDDGINALAGFNKIYTDLWRNGYSTEEWQRIIEDFADADRAWVKACNALRNVRLSVESLVGR